MTRNKLGNMYSIACINLSNELTELYEELFDEEGNPLTDLEAVNDRIKRYQKQVSLEADLIRQSIREHARS